MTETSKLLTVLSMTFTLLSVGCARAPLKNKAESLRKTTAPVTIFDDLPLESLTASIQTEINSLRASDIHTFDFGQDTFTRDEYLSALGTFLEKAKQTQSIDDLYQKIKNDFDFYEVYGDRNWNDVFITSYFEPVIFGSRKPTQIHSTPLYANPKDIVSFDLKQFQPDLKDPLVLRGRLQGQSLVPYYSREEISTRGALKSKKLELCWVDPIDGFFLEIQGSGTVVLPDGSELYVNYSEQNGQRYEPIGKFLKPYLPINQINLDTIETYLRSLPTVEAQKILNLNPSYVFFELKSERSITTLKVPATAGRTIATDSRYFPKGALAILSFEKPQFTPEMSTSSNTATVPVSRFVLDQDTGGAIKGGGRVDLFWGRGAEAKKYAGGIKTRGKLLYLAPKRTVDGVTQGSEAVKDM